MSKTLLIHDRFQFRGGAERLVLDMARILQADIATEFWSEETYPRSDAPHAVFALDKGEPRALVFRYFRAQWNFWWKTRKLLKKYDTIIFSGNNCLAAALRPLFGKKIVYYCHTPVRYVYDLLALRRAAEPSMYKRVLFYDLGKYVVRGMYRFGLWRMPVVITNSHNVHDRLLRFCGRDSQVIYPPIHTEKFSWRGQGDYYLSFARLDSLKRVDDIVRAFQNMPDKKLVIASGGEDTKRITELAKGYENISIVGWVSDEQLHTLVGECIATIYIPRDEDFGMTVLESMAAGKPCIGVNEGGLKETILDGKTGTLLPAKYSSEDLVAAVKDMTPERALAMRNECEQQAQRFSVERFAREVELLFGVKKIAIDASRSIDSVQKTGVEVVSDELLKRISSDVSNLEVMYYTPQEISWLPKVAQRIIQRRRLWTILGLSRVMLRDKPDALFVPVHTLPFFCPKHTVRIIHDVSFLRHPTAYSLRERMYMQFDLWRARRICSEVIVPTEAVKHDLIELLGWPAKNITVTGWGVPENVFRHAGLDPASSVSHILMDPGSKPGVTMKPFILFIGRIEEKKNVANIIRAFEIFQRTHPDWELVLAGKPGYGFENISPLFSVSGVRYLGYISQQKKASLLASARALVLMSHEEGFAFPILEAFQAGVPVLASSIPPLIEIAEDAALFADPDDIDTLAKNMETLAEQKTTPALLVKRGAEIVKKYSWERVVASVMKSLLRL